MLVYSHIWDLFLKCLTIISITLTLVAVHDHVFGINPDAVIPLIVAGAVISIVVYRQLVSILSSWLYARVNLGVPVSFSEAKELRTLFQIHFGVAHHPGWFPTKEVKRLPVDERRVALMTELGRVKAERRWMLL